MKTIATALLALLASCSAVAPTAQDNIGPDRDNRITIYLGQRNLDEDDWEPVEDQGTLGFEYAHESVGAPIGFEFGIMGSRDEEDVGGVDVEGSTSELYGGIRKTFGRDVVRPYVGGGLSFINANAEVGAFDDDDSSIAAYFHGGIGFQLTEMFTLGLDLRFLVGSDIEIAGFDTDADYAQFALFAAFGF